MAIVFYPSAYTGTSGCNPDAEAEQLHYAMKGVGCDEKKIVFLGNRNPQELAAIASVYQAKFGKSLVEQLSKECSGNFRHVVLGLFKDPLSCDSDAIHNAIKGGMGLTGTDDTAIVQILVTKSNIEKQMLMDHYAQRHSNTLQARLVEFTEGKFRDLCIGFLSKRDENPAVDPHLAREDAMQLYQAGEGKIGTDEKKFIQVLTTRSWPQINAIAKAYVEVNKKHHTLLQAITDEFSGPLKSGLAAVVDIAEWGIVDFFADVAYKAMKGVGTNDEQLIRVLLLNRYRPNMEALKVAFKRKHNKPLKEWVHGECSGTYREILMEMIGST